MSKLILEIEGDKLILQMLKPSLETMKKSFSQPGLKIGVEFDE